MGKVGRKSIPTSPEMLQGAKPREVNHGEPKPAPVPPECPEGLSPAAKAKWRELAPQLTELGLFTAIDGTLFVKFCEAEAIADKAAAQLAKDGLFVTDERGLIRKHPALQVWKDNALLVAKLGEQFGLSPAGRKRLHIKTEAEKAYDAKIDAMFNDACLSGDNPHEK